MTKSTIAKLVAESAKIDKKEAELAVSAVFDAIENELATGGKVQIAGFGTFKVKERAARTGRNPRTNETIEIAAARLPVFTAAKALKDAVGNDGE